MDIHPEQLVTEPDGWDAAKVSIAGALAFVAMYAFIEGWHGSGLPAMLVIGLGTGVAGFAELLPPDRRWPAVALRLSGISVLLALIGQSLFSLIT